MKPHCKKCKIELFAVRYVGDHIECHNCGTKMQYADTFPKSVFVENMDKTNAIEIAGLRRVSEMYAKLNDDDKDIIYDLMLRMLGEKQEHN